LAVIATIGTLTALLLPVLSKAKARAMQASCSANLRQLGYAWQMYAIDNGGRLVESYPNNDNPNVWVKGDMTKPTEATNTSLLEAGKLYSYHKRSRFTIVPPTAVLSSRRAHSDRAQLLHE